MTGISSILISGFNNGLIFIPFAIGIGLIYHNLKEIDVSIDGVIIISGIACAYIWIATNSYWLSIIGAIVTGAICSMTVASIQTQLGVHPLMAGLLFSLMAHTFSISLVGESLSLQGTTLIQSSPEKLNISFWHVLTLLSCYLLPIYIYNTHLGLSIRKIGNGVRSNLSYSDFQLKLIAYATTGAIYGVGAGIYVHAHGSAVSGSGFVFLVQSLTAYLLVGKLMPIISSAVEHANRGIDKEDMPEIFKEGKAWLLLAISRESLKAPVGAITLEIIVTALIVWNPTNDPQFWKLSLSCVMLCVLSTFPVKPKCTSGDCRPQKDNDGVSFYDVDFSYNSPLGSRLIFSKINPNFREGLNILTGPNGSGKTTLLRLIAGMTVPDSGAIVFSNSNLVGIPFHKRPIFILMQNPMRTLVPEMKVYENLFLSYRNIVPLTFLNTLAVVKELIEKLSLSGIQINWPEDSSIWQRPAKLLSGGEAYCIAVYCAVLSGCKIILADEPTTGLDDNNYQMVRSALNSLASGNNCTLIIVTHDERLKDMAWNKYTIRDNKIVEQSDWWDARFRDTFFPAVYKLGDNSAEGYLNHSTHDLHSRTERELKIITENLGDISGKRILDCPCGYGRHSLSLSRCGAIVNGVDISPDFIQDARHIAEVTLPYKLRPVFTQGDMRDIPSKENMFDIVINMFLAFGFFDDEGNRKTLMEFHRVLKPGGKLLIHTDVNPNLVAKDQYGDRSQRTLGDGLKLSIDEYVKEGRLEGIWTILGNNGTTIAKQHYSVRIYSHKELEEMLLDVGFVNFSIIEPSDAGGQEVVYLAEKP
jgi:ABC-type lipoprotein export system ATPase subunit/SAM-dependent methyltransferase/ABC-type uncharacterized transport system permease subunit